MNSLAKCVQKSGEAARTGHKTASWEVPARKGRMGLWAGAQLKLPELLGDQSLGGTRSSSRSITLTLPLHNLGFCALFLMGHRFKRLRRLVLIRPLHCVAFGWGVGVTVGCVEWFY